MSVTYYISNKILDYNFGQTSYVVPSTFYVGLSTTTIGNDGTGATEPSGGAYARVAVTNNKTNFTVASNGVLSNATSISFVESTTSWGTITYVFLADALISGNILYFEALPVAKLVQSLTSVFFSVGALSISMTNA